MLLRLLKYFIVITSISSFFLSGCSQEGDASARLVVASSASNSASVDVGSLLSFDASGSKYDKIKWSHKLDAEGEADVEMLDCEGFETCDIIFDRVGTTIVTINVSTDEDGGGLEMTTSASKASAEAVVVVNNVIPINIPVATFVDSDGDAGEVGGTITIVPPEDVSNITHYVIYWSDTLVKSEVLSLEPLVELEKATLTFDVPTDTAIPSNAVNFLVFSKNGVGESALAMPIVIVDNDADTVAAALAAEVAATEAAAAVAAASAAAAATPAADTTTATTTTTADTTTAATADTSTTTAAAADTACSGAYSFGGQTLTIASGGASCTYTVAGNACSTTTSGTTVTGITLTAASSASYTVTFSSDCNTLYLAAGGSTTNWTK